VLQHTTKELRLVVVKLEGKPPKVACVVREAGGVVTIRLALGHRKFAPRSRAVTPAQVLRDATPRERELGFVPPVVAS
jgi:hypothetical protein